jgi:hypothetical protein
MTRTGYVMVGPPWLPQKSYNFSLTRSGFGSTVTLLILEMEIQGGIAPLSNTFAAYPKATPVEGSCIYEKSLVVHSTAQHCITTDGGLLTQRVKICCRMHLTIN